MEVIHSLMEKNSYKEMIPEIEQLRNEMYQRYNETKDTKELIDISQQLDQVMNKACHSTLLKRDN